MKVAVLVSGLLRFYRTCHQSLVENVIVPNDADLFVSTWNILGTSTFKTPGEPWIPIPGEEHELNEEEARQAYTPYLKSFHVEDWQPLQDKLRQELNESCARSPYHVYHDPRMVSITHRILSMWYKVSQTHRLMREYEAANGIKYDVVIRARPDIKHYMPLKMSDYKLEHPIVYIDHPHSYGYVCDQFAFGDRKTMDLYCTMYPKILVYNNQTAAHNAESVMQWHLKQIGLSWSFMDMNYKIVGPRGER